MKYSYLGLILLSLTACTTQTPKPTVSKHPHSLPQPSKTVVRIKQQPEDYTAWIATADHAQSVQAYKQFLKQKGLANLVPDYELLRSARDWQKCGVEPYAVPPRETSLIGAYKYSAVMLKISNQEKGFL